MVVENRTESNCTYSQHKLLLPIALCCASENQILYELAATRSYMFLLFTHRVDFVSFATQRFYCKKQARIKTEPNEFRLSQQFYLQRI
mmetsp:Transcript_15604/g.33726  ORF Transcript_15604/g.33726 Transcript_15604/m.33726 type:complete len:88 (+) Transcript_15604:356-619(+)